jgi:hypothetical protein
MGANNKRRMITVNGPSCPICWQTLIQRSSPRVWILRCPICYMWAHTSIKYIRVTSRFGFVNINSAARNIKECIELIKDTGAVIEEAKELWKHPEYRMWLDNASGPMPTPNWAFADMLGDWGLVYQEKAFRELMPEIENTTWKKYVILEMERVKTEVNNAT